MPFSAPLPIFTASFYYCIRRNYSSSSSGCSRSVFISLGKGRLDLSLRAMIDALSIATRKMVWDLLLLGFMADVLMCRLRSPANSVPRGR